MMMIIFLFSRDDYSFWPPLALIAYY